MEDLESPVPLWIPEHEELFSEKAFAVTSTAGSLLHDPLESFGHSVDSESSGVDFPSKLVKSENSKDKRKVESAYGLFSVMRKRSCRRSAKSSDNDFSCPVNAENNVADDLQNCLRTDKGFLLGRFTGNRFDLQGADTVVSDFVPRYVCPRETVGDEFPEKGSYLPVDESMEDDTEFSESDVISEQVFKIKHIEDELTSLGDEYGFHDGERKLLISTTPFHGTLQEPSKSQSVHGFLASDTNLLPVEDSPGTCSSVDVQLHEKEGTVEDTDTEPAQGRLAPNQEESNSEDEICSPDIGAMTQTPFEIFQICRFNLLPDDSDACLSREEWMSKHPIGTLLRLEECTGASTQRAISTRGAFAILYSRDTKHYIKKPEAILGRSLNDCDVDIDLGSEGYGNKISRHQALVRLEEDGSFSLKNLGKGHIHVDGKELGTGQIIALTSSSVIEIKGISFAFKTNKEAVRR